VINEFAGDEYHEFDANRIQLRGQLGMDTPSYAPFVVRFLHQLSTEPLRSCRNRQGSRIALKSGNTRGAMVGSRKPFRLGRVRDPTFQAQRACRLSLLTPHDLVTVKFVSVTALNTRAC
jgi:hypothetical protein